MIDSIFRPSETLRRNRIFQGLLSSDFNSKRRRLPTQEAAGLRNSGVTLSKNNPTSESFDAGQLTPVKRSDGRCLDRPARTQEAIYAEQGF
jgi:hypothetical protein